MTWRQAHEQAVLFAARALSDYGEDRKPYVDVFAALDRAGISVMGRDMPKLFGVYLSPEHEGGPGVLVNCNRDEATMRHTAAHELGHFMFGHGTRSDQDLDALSGNPEGRWPAGEKEAESFAAWFLMPRKAVVSCMGYLGIKRVQSPEHALQLSLWLGTTFRGTVRQLANLRQITTAQAAAWSRLSPAQLRETGDGPTRRWQVSPHAANATLYVQRGDRVVFTAANSQGVPLPGLVPAGLDPAGSGSPPEASFDVGPDAGNCTVSLDQGGVDATAWKVHLVVAPRREGCPDSWS